MGLLTDSLRQRPLPSLTRVRPCAHTAFTPASPSSATEPQIKARTHTYHTSVNTQDRLARRPKGSKPRVYLLNLPLHGKGLATFTPCRGGRSWANCTPSSGKLWARARRRYPLFLIQWKAYVSQGKGQAHPLLTQKSLKHRRKLSPSPAPRQGSPPLTFVKQDVLLLPFLGSRETSLFQT